MRPIYGADILHLLAPQLEYVCISGVENITPTEIRDACIRIPILPRLKVFEILRNEMLSCGHDTNWFRHMGYGADENVHYAFPV